MGGATRPLGTICALAILAVLVAATPMTLLSHRGSQSTHNDAEAAAASFQVQMLFSSTLHDSPVITPSRDQDPVFDKDNVAVFAISSTGESSYEYWYNQTNPQSHGYYSCQLSPTTVQNAYDALTEERFSMLTDRYNDFSTADTPTDSLTRVTVLDSRGIKSVDFWGNSALGIIPSSYADLRNLLSATMMNTSAPLDVSMNIVATNISASRIQFNVSITNNENLPLYGVWSDGGGYRMLVVSQSGCSIDLVPFAVTLSFINYTIPAQATYNLSSRAVDWDVLPKSNLTVMIMVSLTANQTPTTDWPMVLEFGFARQSVDKGVNYIPSPPFAWIQSSSASNSSGTTINVDASRSADMLDNQSTLQVRWNWDGDLTWDTDWTTNKTASHLFMHSGNDTIRLQVRNSQGLTNEDSILVSVEGKKPDPLLWLGATMVAVAVVAALAGYVILLRRKPATKC